MFYVKKGSTNRSWQKTCRMADGKAIDLTGYSEVRFLMRYPDGAMKVDQPASVIGDPKDGVVRYDWRPEDVDTADLFYAEVHVTFTNGEVEIIPSKGYEHIEIQEDLPL